MSDDLQKLRTEIDEIDDELLKLISRRAQIAQTIGRLKQGNIYRPEREAQVLRRIKEANAGPLSSETAARLFREIMSACLSLEQALKVAYLGPQGTFSQAAAIKHFGKYTECGGVTITALVRDGKALVRVEDTGLGIPEEEHERIFEELYQVHRDRSLGHGLGLAIVRRRSRELGIDLSLESRAGAGSAFTLVIELAGESSAQDPAATDITPAEEHPLPSGLRVLLVDDDERFLRSMQALLEDWECEVLLATGFEAAIEGLNGGPVDIIVTDYRLSRDKTGIDLVHAARTVQADMPALLLSGDTEPEPPRQAGELGIAFLTKPASEEDIRMHIALAMSGARLNGGAKR